MFRFSIRKGFVFTLLVILTLVIPFSSALANQGYLGGEGGSGYPLDIVYPQESTDVVMEEELVQIWLGAQGYEVRVEFIFRNEGSDQVVRMGFPSALPRAGFIDPETGENYEDELQHFQAYVDGQPVPSVTKFGRHFDTVDNPNRTGESVRGDIRWYVQEIPFAKDQRRLVTTKYAVNYNIAPWDDDAVQLSVDYLLRTGASWKGTIGKVTIRVYESDGYAYSPHTIDKWNPAPFKRMENGWELGLEDFEPSKGAYGDDDSDDIHLFFYKSNDIAFDTSKIQSLRDNPDPEGLELRLTTDTEDMEVTSDPTSSPEPEEGEATQTSSEPEDVSLTPQSDRQDTMSTSIQAWAVGLVLSGLFAVGILVAWLRKRSA